MGVQGLWPVLQLASESLKNLDRLRGNRLAVDASIWIYQLTKALPLNEASSRGGGGYNPLVMAGLVRRICKLLHFGIKPVFVFDGGVPILKAATIQERRSRRAEAESRYKRLAKKILKIRMSLVALGANEESTNDTNQKIAQSEDSVIEDEILESEESDIEDFDNDLLDRLDIESNDFKSLPLNLRQELLMALKNRVMSEQLNKNILIAEPENALDFSLGQIDALVKRRRIAGELERASRSGYGSYSNQSSHESSRSHRIASSSTKEFVLMKTDSGGWTFTDKQHNKDIERKEPAKIDTEKDDEDFESMFFGDDAEVFPPTPLSSSNVSIVTSDALLTTVQTATSFKTVIETDSSEEEITTEVEASLKPLITELIESEPEEFLARTKDKVFELEEENELPSLEEIIEDFSLAKNSSFSNEETFAVVPETKMSQSSIEIIEPLRKEIENEEFYLEKDDEDDFLEAYKFTTHDELLDRLKGSLNEAEADLKSAHNESSSVENELLTDFKHLLSLFGIPWTIAPMEAEAQCAWLQAIGLVDGIITDDSDVLVFAPPETPLLVYRHFFKQKNPVLVYSMPRVRLQLALDRQDLVVLAMLLGGDYDVGVRGIGTKRGLEILKLLKQTEAAKKSFECSELEYCNNLLGLLKNIVTDFDNIGAELELAEQKSLEKLVKNIHHLEDSFPRQDVLKAYLEPNVSDDRRPFIWQLPNATGLEKFICRNAGWSVAEFKKTLGPILRRLHVNN